MREIPFLQQPEGSRACGAACLCMVYRQLGLECDLEEVTKKVTIPSPFGPSCRCCKMVIDALERGFLAYCVSVESLKRGVQTFMASGYEVIVARQDQMGLDDRALPGHFRDSR